MKPTRGIEASGKTDQDRLRTVGWIERVDLVDWGIKRLKAKIDTGAHSSALDVRDYTVRRDPAGGLHAELWLALDPKDPDKLVSLIVPVLRMVIVANSIGMCEERPLVETTIRMGPVTKRVRLTLTNRTCMRFRMILGRQALRGDFVVDVARKYLLRKARKG